VLRDNASSLVHEAEYFQVDGLLRELSGLTDALHLPRSAHLAAQEEHDCMQAMFASDRECGAMNDEPNLLVTLFDLPSSQLQRSDPKQLGVPLLFYHPSHSQSGPSMETPDVR